MIRTRGLKDADKKDFIPKSNRNRPETRIYPRYITVHETANKDAGADAEMHSRYAKGGAEDAETSWHYSIDDKQIIQHLPITEKGWHARGGNSVSIGIEICVNSDADFGADGHFGEETEEAVEELQGRYGLVVMD
ncbi:N-acetylmuramoyl-L-alanine amidase family protein [Alteribacillus sp. HJP-4]|uniref:peptidoglycan recognition protein family protein n=1 Tax=Alteribacillus sp. HJP-4 TaxID=2775394 RepID=UPI0035CD2F16